MQPGPKNCITDVSGIKVGHAHDLKLMSGTTVVLPDEPAVAAVDCRGGGPGTRETDALNPANLVEEVHAVVLSGGSAMGLDAAGGVAAWLKTKGRGFPVAEGISVPIVPAAILFDLLNGGEKSRMEEHTYFEFGKMAAEIAGYDCLQGNIGAGTGAKAGTLKGGIGTASLQQKPSLFKNTSSKGFTVGALAVVNPFGSVTLPGSHDFWAWPFEQNAEFGGRGVPENFGDSTPDKIHQIANQLSLDFDFESPFRQAEQSSDNTHSGSVSTNTTLCVVATDAILSKAQAQRIAIMAQDGFARAIRPVHTPFDGDTVFVLATGKIPLSDMPAIDIARLGMMGADCVARAIARGVYNADSLGSWPAYRDSLHH
ncbi:MAG: P1 family peptidase [SAR324 cluster bacterium]|nr:P1 family peptidase [SAR324 cluster bacterium]